MEEDRYRIGTEVQTLKARVLTCGPVGRFAPADSSHLYDVGVRQGGADGGLHHRHPLVSLPAAHVRGQQDDLEAATGRRPGGQATLCLRKGPAGG
jgi:hypothetical protein